DHRLVMEGDGTRKFLAGHRVRVDVPLGEVVAAQTVVCDETELLCGERLRIIDAWLTGVILWCLPSTCCHRVLGLEVVRVPESDAISSYTRGDEVSLGVGQGFDLRSGNQHGDVRALPPLTTG